MTINNFEEDIVFIINILQYISCLITQIINQLDKKNQKLHKNPLEVYLVEVPEVVPVEEAPPQEPTVALSTEEKMLQVQPLTTKMARTPLFSMKRLRNRKNLNPWVVAGSIKPNWKKKRNLLSHLLLLLRRR